MFKKLLKYEYRATARVILPVFSVFLLLVLCTTLTFFVSQYLLPGALMEWLSSVLAGLSFLGFAAVLVVCSLLTVVRFYQMLGDSGYLYFSMPVTPSQHIWSRALVGTTWTMAFLLVCAVGLFVTNSSSEINFDTIFTDFSITWSLFAILLLCLVQCAAGIICGYFVLFLCCALGAQWTQHRLLATFGVYLAMGAISQVFSIVLLIAAWLFDAPMAWLHSLFDISVADGVSLTEYFRISLPLWLMLLGTAILGGICFFVIKKLLEKRLNLP